MKLSLMYIVLNALKVNGLPAWVPYVFVIVGAIGLILVIRNLIMQSRSKRWPQADGIITRSEVTPPPIKRKGALWGIKVEYDYEVNGEKIAGKGIVLGDHSSSHRSEADERCARYPVGRAVKVFYDPTTKNRCLLEPGRAPFWWVWLLVPIVFIAVGVGLIYFKDNIQNTVQ